MKVKVGEQWFEVEPGQPVMIVLTQKDKVNIEHMVGGATKYACFSDSETMSDEEKLEWMRR